MKKTEDNRWICLSTLDDRVSECPHFRMRRKKKKKKNANTKPYPTAHVDGIEFAIIQHTAHASFLHSQEM